MDLGTRFVLTANGYYTPNNGDTWLSLEFPNTGEKAINICNMPSWAVCVPKGTRRRAALLLLRLAYHNPRGQAAVLFHNSFHYAHVRESTTQLSSGTLSTGRTTTFNVEGSWVLNNYILNPDGYPVINPKPFMWPLQKIVRRL